MQRDPRAFLLDVVDAADAIAQAVHGISLQNYLQNRMIRSAVEREFIVIAEALTNLSRVERELWASEGALRLGRTSL